METDELLLARARLLAKVPTPVALGTRARAIVATLGAQRFAFPIERVISVRPLGRWTPVPHAPPTIVGVARLDGKLVAVFGGRSWRGLPEELSTDAPVILLSARDSPLALLVDSAIDAIDIPDDLSDLRRPGEPWLRGIIDDVLLVDIDRLIEHLSDTQPADRGT